MPIHIGSLIQKEVERRRLTYKEFGALIHRNEKTIPDIYDRESMSTDLLLTISVGLKIDFFSFYYTEEPLKSIRNDEVVHLNSHLENFTKQMQRLTEEIKLLKMELSMTKELNDAFREIISLAKGQIEQYKLMLAGTPPCQKDANQSH